MAHHPPKASIVLPIRGMTCRSCELLLEESIGGVPGVAHVSVHRTSGAATITVGGQPVEEDAIERAVEAAGYSVGHEHVPWFSRDIAVYFHLVAGVAILALVALVFLMSGTSLPSFGAGSSLSFSVALLVGLTAGFSTCMALIGGLVLAVSARFAQERRDLTRWQIFQPHLAFNLGRIVGFALLGGLLGTVGSVLQMSDRVIAGLTLIVGIVMLLLGIKMSDVSPRLARFTPTLPRFLQWKRGDTLRTGPPLVGAVVSGALTFFLPCGFTLAMQLAAMNSGNAVTGALTMGAFALGTAPGLLGIGGLASAIRGKAAKVFFATAAVLVIALGIFNLRTAFASFFPPSFSATNENGQTTTPPTTPTGESVTIRMTQDESGYSPARFTVPRGAKVTWLITSTNPYSCASSLRVPALGISKQLVAGANTVEFTAPNAPGDVQFRCSMNMYRGIITVL